MQVEKTQNQVARFALGAPKYVATEALRGEMGWSQFSERYERGLLKIGGKIELMESNSILRKIVKSREGYIGFGREFLRAIDKTGNTEIITRPLRAINVGKKSRRNNERKGTKTWEDGMHLKIFSKILFIKTKTCRVQ